jgi:D-alanyl-D-alanine carboxypeptidase
MYLTASTAIHRSTRVQHPHLWRELAVLILALMLAAMAFEPASAKPRFSALAVDARNGKILFSSDADGLRHPASLTKVMTLYLLFEDLESGKIKLDTKLRVSKRASGMAPSKLGLKPGSSIAVEDAIKALITKSANDVAAVVAENLGGSEAEFAQRMTRTARKIGMSKSVFRNASGLPNPQQVTTARDMATLGLRIQRDFPQYYPYFRISQFSYRGRVYKTHNKLIGRYDGTDGIKTGYIAASGFNLTSSVRRGAKRVVGVVLGAKSGSSRNAYMMKMLDKAFPKASEGKTIAALAGSSKGAIDPLAAKKKPSQASESVAAAAEPDPPAKEVPAAELPGPKETAVLEAKIADVVEGDNEDAAEQREDGEADALPENLPFAVKQETETGAASFPAGPKSWAIQVGTYPSKTDAQTELNRIRQGTGEVLKGKQAFTVQVQRGEETIYRARFSGFTETAAKSACRKLAAQGFTCLALSPQS